MKFRRFLILTGKKFSAAYQAFLAAVGADGGTAEAKTYTDALLQTASNASILQIPSAYKAGVLYNQIPIIGAELVTNGDFATDTDWTKGVGWTIGSGTANASATITDLGQTITIETGKKYRVEYTISNYVSGTVRFKLGIINGNTESGNGTYVEIITAGSSYGVIALDGTATFTGSIDNVSVKQVQDFTVARASDVWRTNEQGVLEVLGNNVPCIDYSDGFPVLLTQPQSTNLVTYSNDFTNWTAGGGILRDYDIATSPDGILNASKIYAPSTGTGFYSILPPTYPVANGGTQTVSIFAKAAGLNWIRFGATLPDTWAYFDLENGIIGTQSGTPPENVKIEDYGNGWFRCSVTAINNNTIQRTQIYLAEADNDLAFVGDDVSGVYIYGAQGEALSYPTSYIPTSGATATRIKDVISGAGSTASINSEEGVLYFNGTYLIDDGDANGKKIAISDGTSANRIYMTPYQSVASWIRVVFSVGGATQADLVATGLDLTQEIAIAVKWKLNDFELYINGVSTTTDVSGTVPTANTFNQLHLGSELGNGTGLLFAKTKQLRVYESIADAQIDLPYIS